MKQRKSERQKRKRGLTQSRRAIAFLFAGVLVFTGLVNAASKGRMFSEKAFWMSVRAGTGRMTGKNESNGVLRGKDNYLFEYIAVPDEKVLTANLNAMKEFRQACPELSFYMLLAPNAANILSDKLPSLAVTENQSEQFERIRKELGEDFVWVDVQKTLRKHKDEDIYYHTDSHWTTAGALYASQELVRTMGLNESSAPELKRYAVTGDFSGNLSLRSGYEGSYREPVYIYSAADAEENTEFVIDYEGEKERTATVYDSSKLEDRDKYQVFFGGDFPLIDIRTAADSSERLLVLKDSYANCLLPFLIPCYREIIAIDSQSYEGNLYQLMEEKRITSVLFLYNGNTFMEERRMSELLVNHETE